MLKVHFTIIISKSEIIEGHSLVPINSNDFSYDEVGNMLTNTDFNGDVTTYTYNALNDYLEHIAYADGSSESFTHDLMGMVLKATQTAM